MRFIALAAFLLLIPAATPASACNGPSLKMSQKEVIDISAAKKKAKKAKKAKVKYMKAAPSK
jgi:hypothetical protein